MCALLGFRRKKSGGARKAIPGGVFSCVLQAHGIQPDLRQIIDPYRDDLDVSEKICEVRSVWSSPGYSVGGVGSARSSSCLLDCICTLWIQTQHSTAYYNGKYETYCRLSTSWSIEVGEICLQYRHRLLRQPTIPRVHRLPTLYQHPPVLYSVARPDKRVPPVLQPHREARQRSVARNAVWVGCTGVPHGLALLAAGEGGYFCPCLFDLLSREHSV